MYPFGKWLTWCRGIRKLPGALVYGVFLTSPVSAFAQCPAGNTDFFMSVGSAKTFADHPFLTLRLDAYDGESGLKLTGFISGNVWFQRSVGYENSFSMPIRCKYRSRGEMTFAFVDINTAMAITRYRIIMSVIQTKGPE